MKVAPLPLDEQRRIETLNSLHILDTAPEERFDRITRLAQKLLNVPIVLISIIDEQRQWFKSKQGLDVSETPRDFAFCAHAILDDGTFVVTDSTLDERFADNPLVTGDPRVRFYAGQPLSALDGQKLGTLCAIDTIPRQLTDSELDILRDLAKMVEDEFAMYQAFELKKQLDVTHLQLSQEMAERETAQQKLALNQANLAAVINNTQDAVWSVDRDQNLVVINEVLKQSFKHTFGADLQPGMSVFDTLPPDSQSEWSGYYARAFNNETFSIEKHYVFPNIGYDEYFEVTFNPIHSETGAIIGASVTSHMISERKRAEAVREELMIQLTASVRELQIVSRLAEENTRLKSEFLATMSHELRTPLNAIEGFTGIMLGNMGIHLEPKAQRMVERIASNSKRLLQLINNFLDISRIESGRLEIVLNPVSPRQLAQHWSEQIAVLGENKGLTFTVEIDDALPERLLADEDALTKITNNLLGNAFKFTPRGSVTLALKRDADRWLISVSDTGIGIPIHAHEYIFDEFRQVDSTSTRLYGGTGLGLAIVQKFTRAMQGTVSLESEMGRGSTFTISLPLEAVAVSPAVPLHEGVLA